MENHAGSLFLEYVAPYVDSTRTDFLGNVYANAINGCEHVNRLQVLLEAHIDEIGFQVVYIDDDGYIYMRQNGGVDVQCIPGSQVVIHTSQGDEIYGIIGKKPMHITDPEERRKSLELHTLWVDTGLPSAEVRGKVSIGDFVSWKSNVIHLSDKRISSKGLDNKVGVYIVSQVLRKLSSTKDISYDVVGVASVQEEVGHRGAIACGYNIKPDIVICIDVDFATDVPNCPKSRFGSVSLGKGVIIHKSIDTNIPLVAFTEHLAKDNNIRYQVSARPFAVGGTNTNVLQLSQGGLKTLSLGIPCRYMHTPVELCDLEDVHSAIDLISTIVVYIERLYNKTF
jgi:endoglucanase